MRSTNNKLASWVNVILDVFSKKLLYALWQFFLYSGNYDVDYIFLDLLLTSLHP